MKNLEDLKKRLEEFKHKNVDDFMCIGYGDRNNTLHEQFGIKSRDLYKMAFDDSINQLGYTGDSVASLYYLKQEFVNKIMKTFNLSNIEELCRRVVSNSNNKREGFVCLGKGVREGFYTRFGIKDDDLYSDSGENMIVGMIGNESEYDYFVTTEYAQSHNLIPPNNLQARVDAFKEYSKDGFICIGYGNACYDLRSHFSLDNVWCDGNGKHSMMGGMVGGGMDMLYYITESHAQKKGLIIKTMKTKVTLESKGDTSTKHKLEVGQYWREKSTGDIYVIGSDDGTSPQFWAMALTGKNVGDTYAYLKNDVNDVFETYENEFEFLSNITITVSK